MRSPGLLFALAALALPILACGKETRQSFDGIYCSHEDEDPMYVCSRAYDLVCIATDKHINANGTVGPDRYLCRLTCKPGEGCPQGVCCPGKVHGNNRGSDYACVPIAFCENPPDAGRRDTGSPEAGVETGSETGGDGGASDSPQDAGAGSDADAGDAAADVPVDGADDATAG